MEDVFIKFLLQKTVFGNLILCAYTASYKNQLLLSKTFFPDSFWIQTPVLLILYTPSLLNPLGLNTLLLLFTYKINYTGFEVSSISLREPKNPLTDILFSRSLGNGRKAIPQLMIKSDCFLNDLSNECTQHSHPKSCSLEFYFKYPDLSFFCFFTPSRKIQWYL